MADFTTTFSCTVGGTAFQLTEYSKSAEGLFDAANNRVGTRVSFECKGEIAVSDATALAAALAAFQTSASGDNVDFSITGFSVLKEQLLAADCIEGPRVRFAYEGDQGHNYQQVRFTVEGVRKVDPNSDGILSDLAKVSTRTNLEGLAVVVLSGQVQTVGGATLASTQALTHNTTRQSGWQQTFAYDRDELDRVCTYQLTQTQLLAEYPTGGAENNRVVDGERTVSSAYDEHNRAMTRYSYSYVGPYAETYVNDRHTALRAAGGLVRASISVTGHKTAQATGEFEVIAARGSGVLELEERISHARSAPSLREQRYPGTTPLIVDDSTPGWVYEQSGRAVGLRVYPAAPAYAFLDGQGAPSNLASKETILNRPNDQEFETSWRFTFLFATEQAIAHPHDRTGSGGTL